MNRLERLHALHDELRRRAPYPVSASVLADRFGVTRRTVERDLVALRNAGVALAADVGRTAGYWLDERPGRAVFSLSPEEVVALLLAARAAEGMPYASSARSAADRLLDALPAATRIAVDDLRSRIRAAPAELPRPKPAVLRAVEASVRNRVVMRITYLDRVGTQTTRAVEAHGIYGATDGWYLIGWCRLRRAGRLFRLDRITRASVTKERAPERDVDDVLGWVPRVTRQP